GATLPALRERLAIDGLIAAATVCFALAGATIAIVRQPMVAGFVLIVAGAAWMTVMASINTAAQTSVSGWVRARALAVSLLVIQGSMAGGAVGWGGLASPTNLPAAPLIAAGGLLTRLLLVGRFQLGTSEGLDLTPASPTPAPHVAGDLGVDGGRVLVTVDYRIDPERADEFVAAMHHLGRVRRRDGARRWGVFQDATD